MAKVHFEKENHWNKGNFRIDCATARGMYRRETDKLARTRDIDEVTCSHCLKQNKHYVRKALSEAVDAAKKTGNPIHFSWEAQEYSSYGRREVLDKSSDLFCDETLDTYRKAVTDVKTEVTCPGCLATIREQAQLQAASAERDRKFQEDQLNILQAKMRNLETSDMIARVVLTQLNRIQRYDFNNSDLGKEFNELMDAVRKEVD